MVGRHSTLLANSRLVLEIEDIDLSVVYKGVAQIFPLANKQVSLKNHSRLPIVWRVAHLTRMLLPCNQTLPHGLVEVEIPYQRTLTFEDYMIGVVEFRTA